MLEDRASLTRRLPRLADRPAVEDQQVGEERPILLRDELHQVLLDLHGIHVFSQTEAGAAAGGGRVEGGGAGFCARG